MKRRLLGRFIFFASNFATLNQIEDKATVDACGICIVMLHASLGRMNAYGIHNRRGLSSLLILFDGQCEGLKRGISDKVRFPRFFCNECPQVTNQ